MKPINKYLIIFLSLFLFAACDFMDCNESDYYSKEQIQGSYARVKQFVTNVYSYLPQDFCSIDGAMQDAATDDAIHVYKTSNVQRFVNGTCLPILRLMTNSLTTIQGFTTLISIWKIW